MRHKQTMDEHRNGDEITGGQLSMQHLRKAKEWFQSMVGELTPPTKSASINGRHDSIMETKSLPGILSFRVEMPHFTWLETALNERNLFSRSRKNSSESDYSRYFESIEVKDTETKTEPTTEIQGDVQVDAQGDTQCEQGNEIKSEEKSSSIKERRLSRSTWGSLRRTMSDSMHCVVRAKTVLRKKFGRIRTSFDSNGTHNNVHEEVPVCFSSENINPSSEDRTEIPKNTNDISIQGKLRLSLQFFQNTKQIRLLLLKGEGLVINKGKAIVNATLMGVDGTQTYESRKAEVFAGTAMFNDNLYFKINSEDLDDYTIKLQVKKTRSFFRRPKIVGEVLVNLGDLPLDLDTNIMAPLYKSNDAKKVMEAIDLQISPQNRSVLEDVMSKLEITDTMQLRTSLKRVRSLPIIGRHKVALKAPPERKFLSLPRNKNLDVNKDTDY